MIELTMIELTMMVLLVLIVIAAKPRKKKDVEYVEFINGKLYVVDKG